MRYLAQQKAPRTTNAGHVLTGKSWKNMYLPTRIGRPIWHYDDGKKIKANCLKMTLLVCLIYCNNKITYSKASTILVQWLILHNFVNDLFKCRIYKPTNVELFSRNKKCPVRLSVPNCLSFQVNLKGIYRFAI